MGALWRIETSDAGRRPGSSPAPARRAPVPGSGILGSRDAAGLVSGMSESHQDVIGATRAFIEASAELREVLASVEVGLLKGIDALEAGGTPMDNLRTPLTRRQRLTMQTTLDQFTDARHRYRTVMMTQCVNDGMKARELSELWGFSRQRASLLIQEVRRTASEDGADAPAVAHAT